MFKKNRNKLILIISVITITFILIVGCIYGASLIFKIKIYRSLKITEDNKNKIIELIELEKENILFPRTCDSMYKIEYRDMFPDGTNYTIYCKEEKNIEFSIDKIGEDVLHSYIKKYGKDKIKFN